MISADAAGHLKIPCVLIGWCPDWLVSQDTEPPEELVKHQSNMSELKRSFLETGGSAPGMTEWEKRLSASPAHSPKTDDDPMIEPLLSQDVSCRAGGLEG